MRTPKKLKKLEEQIEKIKDIVKRQIALELELRDTLMCSCETEEESVSGAWVEEDEEVVEEVEEEEEEVETPKAKRMVDGTMYRRGRRPGNRMCSVEGCENRHAAKGLCASHYAANKRITSENDDVEPEEPVSRVFVPRPTTEVEEKNTANMYCDEEECMNEFVGTLPVSDNSCPACGSDRILLSKYQDDI